MKKYRTRGSGRAILETYDRLLSLWQCETAERDLDTAFGTTHVIECGVESLPPLVLFHGVGDDSALMWIYNAPYLSRYFHLFAVDTLGGPGKSEPNEGYGGDFDDVLWIDGVLSALRLEKAYFAGVSHGGYLTQLYTLRRPERVVSGISISGTVPVGEKNSSMKAMMKIFLPEALFPTDRNVERLIRKMSGAHASVFTENREIMAHYKALLRGFDNRAMRFHKVPRFTAEEVSQIRGRITYLVGNDDPFQKIGGREALLRNGMNAVFYDGAGHGLNHELSDEINRKIVGVFLDAQGGREWSIFSPNART